MNLKSLGILMTLTVSSILIPCTASANLRDLEGVLALARHTLSSDLDICEIRQAYFSANRANFIQYYKVIYGKNYSPGEYTELKCKVFSVESNRGTFSATDLKCEDISEMSTRKAFEPFTMPPTSS